MITTTQVIDVLQRNNITFTCRSSQAVRLDRPVDWKTFGGEGLAYYVGDNVDELIKWEAADDCLILCNSKHMAALPAGPYVFVENPRLCFILVARLFKPPRDAQIHPTAVISHEAIIGNNVSVGPFTVIGAAKIGDNSQIGALVSITDHVEMGGNVIIMSGALIGDPCPGSVYDNSGALQLFPHFERVYIGDNVVIGPGTKICRGALTPTKIANGTHIAANCMIGHNCYIGEDVYLAPSVTLSGRVEIGDNSYLGVGCSIKEGVRLARSTTVGMNAAVMRSITLENMTVMAPATKELGSMFGWEGT